MDGPTAIRQSSREDLAELMKIYEYARRFMAEHGNPHQWGTRSWPPEELIRADIAAGKSYVCLAGNRIAGTFFYDQGKEIEPTYRVIECGVWKDDRPYGVVHRLAGSGIVKGVGRFCLDWAFRQCGHLRIDTHGDNRIMQNLLRQCGFQRCGIIYTGEDHSPRIAYEKSDTFLLPDGGLVL